MLRRKLKGELLLEIIQDVGELSGLDDMFVLVFLGMFVLPHALVGDVDAIASEGDDRVDVALEGIAD